MSRITRTQPVNLRILDRDYVIACPADECENLMASAEYLTKKMQEVRESGKVVSTERIAVMAALNIVHELIHGRGSGTRQTDAQFIPDLKRLATKVERILEELPD
jgi:cell division protein ZapA